MLRPLSNLAPFRRPHFVGGGGGSPGTTNLKWWYDFTANGNDSHTGGWDLSVEDDGTADTPTYSDGRVAVTEHIRFNGPSSMDAFLDSATQACSVACRFVIGSGWTNELGYPVHVVNGYTTLRMATASTARNRIGNFGPDISVTWAANDVIMMVVKYDGVDIVRSEVWQNGTKYTGASTGTFNEGGAQIGIYVLRGAVAYGLPNVEMDWVGGWDRELTDDEITWLWNSGATRNYADL